MKAIVYTETGHVDVLELVDRPASDPAPGEVAVSLRRSGVNPTDVKARKGTAAGTRVDPPQVPGQDGAGVIVAVGDGVAAELLGARVWLWEAAHQRSQGTTEESLNIPWRQTALLPDSASFDLGAALGVPFITAHRCLTISEHGPRHLGPDALEGHTVLVAGGAGAVGNAAIQLARWSDATVITTVSSPQKAQLAAAAGADHIIDYRRQDVPAEIFKINPHGVDTIVEVSLAQNAAIDSRVLRTGGALASYATDGGAEVTLAIRALMTKNARVQFVLLYTAPAAAKRQAVDDITAALATNSIRIGPEAGLPLHHYRLDQTREAHTAVENGVIGKVLIDLAD